MKQTFWQLFEVNKIGSVTKNPFGDEHFNTESFLRIFICIWSEDTRPTRINSMIKYQGISLRHWRLTSHIHV